ncbi:MAG: hypothetical protein ACTHNS_01190 [Marmoricola sp.]
MVEIVIGAGLVVLVFVDAFMTTLSLSSRAGPLTQHVLALVWRLLVRAQRRRREGGILSAAGTVLLVGTVLTWVTTLWVGWFLVFLGSGSVMHDFRPAGALDVAYFAGFDLVTLGTGDVVAGDAGWRFVSAVASFTGLFLVTLAITYLVSVVSAVVARRTLATQIDALGRGPQEIVRRAWRGDHFSSVFVQQLVSLTPSLVTLAEHHIAYPVLHYFRAAPRTVSAPLAIAALDDALVLLSSAVAADSRPDPSALRSPRTAIERYVETASFVGSMPHVDVPPVPDRRPLAAAGIPLADEADYARGVTRAADRRRGLRQLVVSDGWDWDDMA